MQKSSDATALRVQPPSGTRLYENEKSFLDIMLMRSACTKVSSLFLVGEGVGNKQTETKTYKYACLTWIWYFCGSLAQLKKFFWFLPAWRKPMM